MPLGLCHSAQAVSDGDRERCRSLLFEARQECIRSLATVSTESVSSVNPAILQLQQLQCVQEAWAFRWPTLSLASPPSPGLVSYASSLSDHALWIEGQFNQFLLEVWVGDYALTTHNLIC